MEICWSLSAGTFRNPCKSTVCSSRWALWDSRIILMIRWRICIQWPIHQYYHQAKRMPHQKRGGGEQSAQHHVTLPRNSSSTQLRQYYLTKKKKSTSSKRCNNSINTRRESGYSPAHTYPIKLLRKIICRMIWLRIVITTTILLAKNKITNLNQLPHISLQFPNSDSKRNWKCAVACLNPYRMHSRCQCCLRVMTLYLQ